MKELGGSIPQVVQNPDGRGIKRLFYSQRDVALILNKTFAPGYGVLKAGTVCCVNSSSAGNTGKVYPYVPVYGSQVAALNTDAAIGIAPMVANSSTGHVYVSIENSYKFIVGDQIYFQNTSGDGLVDCGVITAIDRTTNPIYADIACGAFTATNGTIAKHAYIYVVSGSTPFSIAKYILDKDIDTGVGEDAVGALGTVVVSNAILYSGSLINCTSEARTSMSASTDGQFTILK
jgi:hypothetical protein